jgi:hypothetical protein
LSVLILICLFLLPVLIALMRQYRKKREKKTITWIEFEQGKPLDVNGSEINFRSVPSEFTFELEEMTLWIDHGGVVTQDLIEYDVFTNTINGYESVLKMPVVVNNGTENKRVINLSMHLKAVSLSCENVLIVSKVNVTGQDQVCPSLLRIGITQL